MKDQEKLHIVSNTGKNYEIGSDDLSSLKILNRKGNFFTVQYNDRILKAEIIKSDHRTKNYTIQLDGKILHYELETELDVLVREMGMEKMGSLKIDQIISPMPGLVLDILVESGDEIQEGSAMLILEAMKMENVIKAPSDVVIDQVFVKKGDSVDKQTVLISFK